MITMRSAMPLCLVTREMRVQLTALAAAPGMWAELATALELTESELRSRLDALAQIFPDTAVLVDLLSREVPLLELLDSGATQPEIAKQLNLSLSAVKKQVASLYRKLGAESRTEAMRAAYELRLLKGSRS